MPRRFARREGSFSSPQAVANFRRTVSKSGKWDTFAQGGTIIVFEAGTFDKRMGWATMPDLPHYRKIPFYGIWF